MQARRVLVTGATGYLGSRLVPALVERGHSVRVLVRPGSEGRAPGGSEVVLGDPLEPSGYGAALENVDTLVHLVGVAHPSPAKAQLFRSVDLRSALVAVDAARAAQVQHFVYVSVAQPAPVMGAYVAARAEAERYLTASGLSATVLRPWYVLGPGHLWPLLLLPLYWLAALFPGSRDGAARLGLVRIGQMVRALVAAVETPAGGLAVRSVPEIRGARA